MQDFKMIVLTPPVLPKPSIAIAATRTGGLGILDLEYIQDKQAPLVLDAISSLARYAKDDYGIKLSGHASVAEEVTGLISGLSKKPDFIILTCTKLEDENLSIIKEQVQALHNQGLTVLWEAICLKEARFGEEIGVDGIIAKGHESGGRVGEETTFVLLQRLLKNITLPVYAQGGIGLHTASACYASGAAGIVLDSQLLLTRESPLPDKVKDRIALMDGSETACFGHTIGEFCRVYSRPNIPAVEEISQTETELLKDECPKEEALKEWHNVIASKAGWDSPETNLLLLGQDAAFAKPLADKFVTVGGILQGIRQAIDSHVQTAERLHPLDEGSSLAEFLGTRYPIFQGPMARISDIPSFTEAVAEAGAIPFLAISLMPAEELKELLEETNRLLDERPWGVGLIGFLPSELFAEQVKVICECSPSLALIAGGHPKQNKQLEEAGIPTYMHVPSPGLLKIFLQNGDKRFILEGRESGGHVGPRTSFVLWESMIDEILDYLSNSNKNASDYEVLFAGGIHDSLSASMISVLAAPLAELGVKTGVQMGTAYLFTEELVQSGGITKTYQKEAIKCDDTVVLEVRPGHANRCVCTSFAESFDEEKLKLKKENKSTEEIQYSLEQLSIGRLQVASKGTDLIDTEEGSKVVKLTPEEQRERGIYMIGQVGALQDRICNIKNLHYEVSIEGTKRLSDVYQKYLQSPIIPEYSQPRGEDIAIIGMATLMPRASNLQAYWQNILNKVNTITEVPKERWDWEMYYDSDPRKRDKVYSKWGAFLDDETFDPTEFGMPPNTLFSIEPLQLLTLNVAREALKDAGYWKRSFERERTAVFIGAGGGAADMGLRYGFRALLPHFVDNLSELPVNSEEIISLNDGILPEWTEDSFPGILMNVLAGRIANRFNLGGTNYVVDAACASSLAAVDAAIKELETYTSDMVIVGGADTMQSPYAYTCFSKTHALSPTGRCLTLDEKADGIVLGEGIAIVILKRLADAERDGDKIYAVLKGIGTSSDGRSKSLTAPNPQGQALALKRAYEKANLSPSTIGLVEAHGTGTVVGDKSEIESLKEVFNGENSRLQICAIGSVKSMIGHTKCAAGVASLVKAALALHDKILPPTLGVDKPNPEANFPETPFYVNTETRPWINGANEHPRRAGISAFGFGGTNFHVVLEEYTDDFMDYPSVSQEWPSELFVWRENDRQSLLETIEDLENSLSKDAAPELRNLAYTLSELYKSSSSPRDSEVRLAIVAKSLDELRQKLLWAKDALKDAKQPKIDDPRGIYYSEAQDAAPADRKIAFLFPGQGSQYINMLNDLAIHFPIVRKTFEKADKTLKSKLHCHLSNYIFPPPTFSEEEENIRKQALTQTNVAQPAIGAADMAMFHLLSSLGIRPNFVAGHSYGEYVALCAAGVFSEEVLIDLSEARGRFIVESAGEDKGTMAAINADVKTVSEVIEEIEGVYIANMNSSEQTIITGTQEAVEQAVGQFKAQGTLTKLLPVACAFHSPIVAPARERLKEFLSNIELKKPEIEVFSNTTADSYPQEPEAISELLCEHLISPVKFVQEIEALYEAETRIFVEVGPRGVLTKLVNQILENKSCLTVASNQSSEQSELFQLHHLLGKLTVAGVPVKLDKLYQKRTVRQLDLNALQKESSEEVSPTTWIVNGTRAKPINGTPVPKTKQTVSEAKPETKSIPEKSSRQIEQTHLSTEKDKTTYASSKSQKKQTASSLVGEQKESTSSTTSAPNKSQKKESVSSTSTVSPSENGSAQIMVQFQNMMNSFLDTQRNVMLAYLQGNGEANIEDAEMDIQSSPPKADSLTTSSQRTESQQPSTQSIIESEVKTEPAVKSEIHKAEKPEVQTENVEKPKSAVSTETTERDLGQTFSESSIQNKQDLKELLLQVVSERTGYPPDMLDIDLDLEADLGIDSIKRVEILGSLQDLISFSEQDMEQSMEEVTRLKTLRDIIDWIESHFLSATSESAVDLTQEKESKSKDLGSKERQVESESQETVVTDTYQDIESPKQDDSNVKRFTLKAFPTSLNGQPVGLSKERVVVLTDDENGIASCLSERLKTQGYRVAMVKMDKEFKEKDTGSYTADITSPEEVVRLLEVIRQRQGKIGTLIHLLPLKKADIDFENTDMNSWNERLQLEVKSLFYFAKNLSDELREAAQDGGACLMAATGMSGTFASVGTQRFSPSQGSISGLLKSISHEWPEVRIKAVDLNTSEDTSVIVDHIWQEMTTEDGQVEVGYDGSQRVSLQLVSAPVNLDESKNLAIDSSWIIMATGGARGITADVVRYLAERYQPTLLLVGRSPLPESEESEETASLNSPNELKAALIAQMRTEGKTLTPAEVEAKFARLMKDREMRENIAAMRDAGAKVHYYQADVKDEENFSNLIDEIYQTYGRIDGVIHGAGVIEDKFVKDKTPDSFDRVFDTKVESAFILSQKLRADSLKFLVFFSSVAGRFGNRGQCDYSAANEVYNKLAVYLDSHWQGRIFSVMWGPWARSGGMVSSELEKQFARHGVELVPRSVGPGKLDEELCYGQKGEAEVILGSETFQGVLNRSFSKQTLPLIGDNNFKRRSEDCSVEFVRHLSPDTDLYLQHHKLDGKSVLPMAVALELMTEVVSHGWPKLKIAKVSDLRVLQGVVLQEREKAVQIVAKPIYTDSLDCTNINSDSIWETDEDLKVEVKIVGMENPQQVHYRAVFDLSNQISSSISYEPLSLTEKRTFPMNIEEAYQKWLFHGPLLQGITKIESVGSNGIIASLTPSAPQQLLNSSSGDWLVDPVVVDCGLQLTILWGRMYWDMTTLPSRLGNFRCFSKFSDENIRCEVQILENSGNNIMHTNITFLSKDGEILGILEDMEFAASTSLNRLAGKWKGEN